MKTESERRGWFEQAEMCTIRFDIAALRPLQKLYWQIYAGMLAPEVEMGLKLHEEAACFADTKMRWFFANSERAMAIFRDALDGSELRACRQLFGRRFDLNRVVQGNLIETRGGYPRGTWHSDFTDDEIRAGTCITVLTPLFPFQPHFGGLEVTSAKRGISTEYDAQATVYRYQSGEAVVFDGATMIHRTQQYHAGADERRLVVSWQLADTSRKLRPMLSRIATRNGDPMFYSPHLKPTRQRREAWRRSSVKVL